MSEFVKLVNFRDLGGLPAAEGKKIKPHRLLRSARLYKLPNEDKRLLLDEYELKVIFDLRGKSEIEREPDDIFEGVEYISFDLMQNYINNPAALQEMQRLQKPENAHESMCELYKLLIKDEHAIACWRQMFDVLLRLENGAVLFHCYAGKDRTGIAAAIFLTALGVEKELIIEDYMQSAVQREKENNRVLTKARDAGMSEEELEGMKIKFSVSEDFIHCTYEAAEELYGGFEGFVKNKIGLSNAETEKLRSLYLE